MIVAGSLWSVAAGDLIAEASRLTAAGLKRWHWDAADGSLGPSGGFRPALAYDIAQRTGCASEAHLMTLAPLDELDLWLAFCERVSVHPESPDAFAAVERIEAAGRRACLAYAPGSATDQHPPALDALVMSVRPGHGGSVFQAEALHRIAELAPRAAAVGVDGGVGADEANAATAAGATWIVSGTALLTDPAAFGLR